MAGDLRTYLIQLPDGRVVERKSPGPWFMVWRLSRRCMEAWGVYRNDWSLSGGWIYKKRAKQKAAVLRTATGWAQGSLADTRVGPGPRLMCGRNNVKIVKGLEVNNNDK